MSKSVTPSIGNEGKGGREREREKEDRYEQT